MPVKGRFTIRTAAVFFGLSAVLSAASAATPVPLAGALRTGIAAAAYHVALALLFAVVGVGLWQAARWGPRAVYLATAAYTLDNLRYLLDLPGRRAELLHQLRAYPDVIETFGADVLLQVVTLLTLVFVACWWGFAAYIYWRRDDFQGDGSPSEGLPSASGSRGPESA